MEAAPGHDFLARPLIRNLGALASSKSSLETPYGHELLGLYPKLHDKITSNGFGDTSYNNYRAPVVQNNTQAWEFNNGMHVVGLPGSVSLDQSAVTHGNGGDTQTQMFISGNSQDLDYSAPLLEHNDGWEAYNASVAGTSLLDMLSLDVGHAAYEKLMSEQNVFQDPASGLGSSFSDPSIAPNFSMTSDPLFQPTHGAFDLVERQGLPVQQMPEWEYQGQVQLAQGQPPISIQPTQQQQLTLASQPFLCAFGDCAQSFRRKADLARHRKSVHGVNHVKYFCHIPGCPKSQGHGQGYSRDDKLTEHLWKQHRNLGFTKSR